jgi:hypothetical protein
MERSFHHDVELFKILEIIVIGQIIVIPKNLDNPLS